MAMQDRIFKDSGVRWSELWRLPYWDPTQQLVMDSMHCIFEGLCKGTHLESQLYCRLVVVYVHSPLVPMLRPLLYLYTPLQGSIDPDH